MKDSFKHSLMFIVIILALLVSALGVTPARADDETPPPPATEEPALPPTEEPTQLPVVVTEPEVEPIPALAVEEGTAAPINEDVLVTELLAEAPENTDIVVQDGAGESLPLASQDAAEVIAEADPKWCPQGVLPNSPSCSINFPSIAALLADMQAQPAFYSQNGVIYFERSSLTTYTSSFVLDDSAGSLGTSYDTLKAYNITLRGGWAGGTSTSLNSTSLFDGPSAYVQVGTNSNPWVGNVALTNIFIGTTTVGISTNNSLTIYTSTGDITLNNVEVRQQEGSFYTGYLESDSGDITISNTSVFDGNNAAGKTNKGLSATTDSGTISIANTTIQNASGGLATNYDGATLSAPVVNLTSVIARSNDGSGIYVNGTGSTIVNVFRGTFNNNGEYGLEVTGSILNQQTALTSCTGNAIGCYNVMPNTIPAITVNKMTVEANAFGGWTLDFSAIGSASDAEDGTPAVTCTPALGSFLAVGTTTLVSCTASDSGGLTAASSENVQVVDTTAPSLSLPSGITVEATGPTGAAVTYAPTATDVVSGAVAVGCKPASGSTFALGTTSVYCWAVDGSGNQAQGSFNVTVNDTGAPVLTLPADMNIVVNDPSDATVTYSASAFDVVDGSVPVSCTPASGSTFSLGTTAVDCSATDSAGNTANGSFNVTLVDITAPILTLPADMTVEATGPTGAVVTFASSANDIVSGAVGVICVPASGSTFALGKTAVSCLAADGSGNQAKGSFNVTVEDTTAPTLTLPANISRVVSKPSDAVVTYAASASDLIDGNVAVSCTPASGSTFALGTTVVDCKATDGSGNTTSGKFNVTLKDTGAPVLTLPADISIVTDKPSKASVTYSASATDSVEGPIAVVCVPASGSIFPEGTTLVKCSATDSSGNTTYGSFKVTVEVNKVALYRVIEQTEAQLPSALGQGNSFGSALKLEYIQPAAKNRNLTIQLSFPIPDTMKDADLSVLFWTGSQWVEIPGGGVVDNYFVIYVTKPGFYVLVSQ